jgi:hypothetical protein
MEKIAGFIALLAEKGEDAIPEVKAQVISLCEKYPLYEGGTID